MSFFKSEVVRAEIAKINDLQEEVYKNIFKFPTMTKEEKLYQVSVLEELLDKQKVLYTRLSLSDDPEAQEMKEHIMQSATMMGLSPSVDITTIMNNMSKMLEIMKQRIDKMISD